MYCDPAYLYTMVLCPYLAVCGDACLLAEQIWNVFDEGMNTYAVSVPRNGGMESVHVHRTLASPLDLLFWLYTTSLEGS